MVIALLLGAEAGDGEGQMLLREVLYRQRTSLSGSSSKDCLLGVGQVCQNREKGLTMNFNKLAV